MNINDINWDEIPNELSKEQVRIIGHMSKATTLYLLQSGKLPCIYSGKKTRCYRIKKSDFIAFLEEREKFPELYMAPEGWYSGRSRPIKHVPFVDNIKDDLHDYYAFLLKQYPDVMTIKEVCSIIGYGDHAVVKWCSKGLIKSFILYGKRQIPKVYLIDFLCSKTFRTITKKSNWHKHILLDYPRWKNSTK